MNDDTDKAILNILQRDSSLSLDELAAAVHLSRNACWRRIRQMEEAGLIRARVALLDAKKLNVGLTAFIALRATEHTPGWLNKFAKAVKDIPEIIGSYRMTGDIDYLLIAVIPDVAAYDGLYKRLIDKVPLADVSSSFVMEEIKATTALPLHYATKRRGARE
jgi:Lrp/AsnC family transcriptional regulator